MAQLISRHGLVSLPSFLFTISSWHQGRLGGGWRTCSRPTGRRKAPGSLEVPKWRGPASAARPRRLDEERRHLRVSLMRRYGLQTWEIAAPPSGDRNCENPGRMLAGVCAEKDGCCVGGGCRVGVRRIERKREAGFILLMQCCKHWWTCWIWWCFWCVVGVTWTVFPISKVLGLSWTLTVHVTKGRFRVHRGWGSLPSWFK
jgi:hypothetical protein